MNKTTTLAIDLAKQVFQLHGADFRGKATLRQKVRRGQLPALLAQTPPCSVVMEACASSHYWAREARSFGHKVRLIAPQHVRAFTRGQKNDRNDAEAIAIAAGQPGIPEVAVKSEEQQAHGVASHSSTLGEGEVTTHQPVARSDGRVRSNLASQVSHGHASVGRGVNR